MRRSPSRKPTSGFHPSVARAFALSSADLITYADLAVPAPPEAEPADVLRFDGASLPTLAETERRLVAAALRESGGNKNEAARLLGIDRQRLYRKIEKYNL